jgi:hypothetical protein
MAASGAAAAPVADAAKVVLLGKLLELGTRLAPKRQHIVRRRVGRR